MPIKIEKNRLVQLQLTIADIQIRNREFSIGSTYSRQINSRNEDKNNHQVALKDIGNLKTV